MRLSKMFTASTQAAAEAMARKWLSHKTGLKNPTTESMAIRASEDRITKNERGWTTVIYYDE